MTPDKEMEILANIDLPITFKESHNSGYSILISARGHEFADHILTPIAQMICAAFNAHYAPRPDLTRAAEEYVQQSMIEMGMSEKDTFSNLPMTVINRSLIKAIIYGSTLAGAHPDTGGWVSVSERLPDRGVEVLIIGKYDEIPVQAYWDGTHWVGSDELRDWMNDGFVPDPIISNEFLSHWQPLPAPPHHSPDSK